MTDETVTVRELVLHGAATQPGVVSIKLRPAILVCELEDGSLVEVEERIVQMILPPLTEPIEEA